MTDGEGETEMRLKMPLRAFSSGYGFRRRARSHSTAALKSIILYQSRPSIPFAPNLLYTALKPGPPKRENDKPGESNDVCDEPQC